VPLAFFDGTETEFPLGFGAEAEQLVTNITLTFVNAASVETGSFNPEIVARVNPVTLAVAPNRVDILFSIRGTDVAPLVGGTTTATLRVNGVAFGTVTFTGDSSVADATGVLVTEINGSPTMFCGSGVVDLSLGEQCDDGNTVDGDGCSAICEIEQLIIFRRNEWLANGRLRVFITVDPIATGLVRFYTGVTLDNITCESTTQIAQRTPNAANGRANFQSAVGAFTEDPNNVCVEYNGVAASIATITI
jgi:cysteine-rich repeat protein